MECLSCRATVPERAKFCMECGAPLPRACRSCGHSLPAAAKFCPECGAPVGTPVAMSRADMPAAGQPMPSAERRQLTVMFCDLVGSTALSARLDPEELRDVIGAYHRCIARVVERFQGYVAKYMGDGVLVYFGYPQAHEDDAERAIRSGLDLVSSLEHIDLKAGLELRVRIGIATGLVVVGDLIGEGAAREQAVVGETPNLAARLQSLAEPCQVVISQSTRQLIGDTFELAELGEQWLKGIASPVRSWRVLRPSAVESRFEAFHGANLAPLIGREQELALLFERLERAKEGEGQVVLLSGEPGIGKSRLLQSLRRRLLDQPHIIINHFCSPYSQHSALNPIIARIERSAGLRRDDKPEAQLDKLEALLAMGTDNPQEVAPLIADLLAIPTGARYPPTNLTPTEKKEKTLQALVDQLAGLAARQPVLALYEDVHWADPSTLELLGAVVDRIQQLRVLVVMTFRPEFAPPWTGYAHITTLTLNRLTRRQVEAIVQQVTGGKPMPAVVVEQILAKTDGVPLFVEELTKAILEAGLLRDAGDRFELAGPLPPLATPATLHDSLMARLDRLAPIKAVAQIGAVIGREFSHELVAAVAPQSEQALTEALDQLVGAELIFRRGVPPHATYTFKHALVQDVAYASLLKSRRQQLHARIGLVLQENLQDSVAVQPELLAHHFTEAGLTEQAISYWRRAGERARERSANLEAIAHLTRGLELLQALPDTPRRAKEELAFQLALGGPLTVVKGYAALEVERTHLRARELAERLGKAKDLFPVLRGLWHCYLLRGHLTSALELAHRLVSLAEEDGEPFSRAIARRALGSTLFFFARFGEASEQLQQGIAFDDIAEGAGDQLPHILLHMERPGIICRLYLAWLNWLLGYPDTAMGHIETAVALSRRLSHAYSLAFALTFETLLRVLRREFKEARRQADAAIEVAREHSFAQYLAMASMLRGIALARLGEQDEGLAILHAAFTKWCDTGSVLIDTMWLGLIAEVLEAAGQIEAGLAALDRAEEVAADGGEIFYRPELARVRGVLNLRRGDDVEARRCLSEAVDLARCHGTRSLELRAATDLARFYRDQGRFSEAEALLAPVLGWFTEGLDTADLRQARLLLAEMTGVASLQRIC